MNTPFNELVDLVGSLGRLSVVLQSEGGGETDLVLRQAQLLHGLSRLHQPQGLEQYKHKAPSAAGPGAIQTRLHQPQGLEQYKHKAPSAAGPGAIQTQGSISRRAWSNTNTRLHQPQGLEQTLLHSQLGNAAT